MYRRNQSCEKLFYWMEFICICAKFDIFMAMLCKLQSYTIWCAYTWKKNITFGDIYAYIFRAGEALHYSSSSKAQLLLAVDVSLLLQASVLLQVTYSTASRPTSSFFHTVPFAKLGYSKPKGTYRLRREASYWRSGCLRFQTRLATSCPGPVGRTITYRCTATVLRQRCGIFKTNVL